MNNTNTATTQEPNILYRTKGQTHGPITRLVSPGDLGEMIKPFVFLDSFSVDSQAPVNMGYHPHSGIVTVTTIFSGSITYEDSTGKSGVLPTGSVEWMQAGNGVWHTSNSLAEKDTIIKGFQLWLALSATLENTDPESLYINPEQINHHGPARVIVGEYKGVSSPLPNIGPLLYLHVNLKDGESWTFDRPQDYDVLWLSVDEGSLHTEEENISKEVVVFDSTFTQLTVHAKGETNFVLGSAVKHPHPLITGSYSVHTSPESLRVGETGIAKVGKRLKSEGRL